MQVREEIKQLLEEVTKNRRHIHKYPEIGLETPNTRAYIVERLKSYGYTEIEEGSAQNGVIACLKVNDDNQYIGFRADIDALPITETGTYEYKSCNSNSHSCGHDGHTSALLGFAKYAIEHKDKFNQNLLFVFQPGEEGPGGAEIMIKEGLFEKYPCTYMFGTHVMAGLPVGKIASRKGGMMARNGSIYVTVNGKGAHGAMPHQGVDAIVVTSAFIMQLQAIISRMNNPLENGVITIAKMHGGNAQNVICDEVLLEGTIRSFDDDSYNRMKDDLVRIGNAVGLAYQANVKVEVIDDYRVVYNNSELVDLLAAVSKDSYVEAERSMGSEDFSFYLNEVPGVFFYTGVEDELHTKVIHDSAFDFDEVALLNAIETYVRLLEGLQIYHD